MNMASNAADERVESDPELMTAEEAAAYLRVSLNTLYNWTSRNYRNIPFGRAGTALRFRKSELDAWMSPADESTVNAPSTTA